MRLELSFETVFQYSVRSHLLTVQAVVARPYGTLALGVEQSVAHIFYFRRVSVFLRGVVFGAWAVLFLGISLCSAAVWLGSMWVGLFELSPLVGHLGHGPRHPGLDPGPNPRNR